MHVFYFATEQPNGWSRIDVVYQENPPASTPSPSEVLFYAIGQDAEQAKANLIAIARSSGDALVAEAEARVEGTKLAIRELTT